MELDTVAKVRAAWYRLVGAVSTDPALALNSEAAHDVAYLYLTRGTRSAQRWMLKQGYQGWRTRSTDLTWDGSDAEDGGRYTFLPIDFLRAYSGARQSAIVGPDGTRWGTEVAADFYGSGDGYTIRGDQLWISSAAAVPTTVYLDYHYLHPAWDASVAIDFPMEARPLIVAEAAYAAMDESWLAGDRETEAKISRALANAREEARDIARPTKAPRRLRPPPIYGTRW